KAFTCPHCKSNRIRANGKLKGVQRYLCNGCKKNFSETTGKFWFALKKKLNQYLYCLLSGYSILKSVKETGISIQTSFDWRHKLLTSFSSVSVHKMPAKLFELVLGTRKNKEHNPNKMTTIASIALASNQAWMLFKEIAVNNIFFII
ncbi:MAG: transposase, partial [Polaribacter sp.]